ncbi:MAG: hypothetical protein QM500_14900 [Methylococcales bacterium]
MISQKQIKADLTIHWMIVGMMLIMLVAYHVICYTVGTDIRINLPEEQRIFIRSILYVITIILFPLINLLRHILLRLNQTMPGDTSAKNRYLMTTVITLASIETVGMFGFIMFMLGDEINSLYIFSLLGVLGLFLHRPREQEYRGIIEALKK